MRQVRDLEELLGGEFAWVRLLPFFTHPLSPLFNHLVSLQVGVGRDDGREAGEFSPIFYRR